MLTKDKTALDMTKAPYMKYACPISMYGGDSWKVYYNTGSKPEFSDGKVILVFVRPATDPIPFERPDKDKIPDPDDLFSLRPKLLILVVGSNGGWHITALPGESVDFFDTLEASQGRDKDGEKIVDTPEVPEWGKAIDQSDGHAVEPQAAKYDALQPERALQILAMFCGSGAVDIKTAIRKIQKLYAMSDDPADGVRATLLHPSPPTGTDVYMS